MISLVDLTLAASGLRGVATGVVFVLFVVSAFVLTIVILLQEGKGGGLGSAFGGAAADAFGVKAGTVNKFTAYLAAAFLGLALLYGGLKASGDRVSIQPAPQPAVTGTGGGGTPDGTVQQPAGQPEAPEGQPEAPEGQPEQPEGQPEQPGDGEPSDG